MTKTKEERALLTRLRKTLTAKHFKRRTTADEQVIWYERTIKRFLYYYADIEGENYYVAVRHEGQTIILKRFRVVADLLDSMHHAKLII